MPVTGDNNISLPMIDCSLAAAEALTSNVITLPNGWKITLTDDNKVLLSAEAYLSPVGILSVPVEIGIEEIDEEAFKNCLELREIELPEGIEKICDSAFLGCLNLTKVTLPKSLSHIENDVFKDCAALTDIALPDHLAVILEGVFIGCNNLKQLKLPRGVFLTHPTNFVESDTILVRSNQILLSDDGTELRSPEGCIDANGSFIVPATVTRIGYKAFCGRLDLRQVVLPLGLQHISAYAFDGCGNLSEIALPDTVREIEEGAFQSCDQLKTVVIPRGLVVIDETSFDEGVDLKRCTTMTLSDDGATLLSPEGCVGPDGSFTTPESVQWIAYCSFYGRKDLQKITLPDILQGIGEYAFGGCENLGEMTLPGQVSQIAERAFYNCNKLQEITLPSSLQMVDRGAFDYCVKLDVIQIDGNDDDVIRIAQLLPKSSFDPGGSLICQDLGKRVVKKSLYPESKELMAKSLEEVEGQIDKYYNAFAVFLSVKLQSKKGTQLNADAWRLIACFFSSNRPSQYARAQQSMQKVQYPRRDDEMPVYRSQIEAIKGMTIKTIESRARIFRKYITYFDTEPTDVAASTNSDHETHECKRVCMG